MKTQSKIRVLVFAISILINLNSWAFAVDANVPTTNTQTGCQAILKSSSHGLQAVSELGSNIQIAAKLNMRSVQDLQKLLTTDSSFWLDRCGLGFYVEESAKNTSNTAAIAAAPFAYDQTFRLHSNLGSNKTIYLDFNGHTFTNTAWNSYFKVASTYFAKGYSQDSDFSTFTNAEMDVIQSVWQRVAEDYAPFDVDVTTEEPALGVLERATSSDNVYGTRAVITGDSALQSVCGCGGVAYVGVFDTTGTNHEYYQPAWIFTPGVGTGAKNITEALSHEVGHNLGLSHDGTSTAGYYSGSSGWAPIMGVGYYQGLTQWSKGEYANANNFEDDYSVMAANGAVLKADEDSNSSSTSRNLVGTLNGVLSSRTDSDWFSFTPSANTTATFQANVAAVSPNLDLRMDLYLAGNVSTPIATSNPTMAVVNGDLISGLSASLSYNLSAGLTYYLVLDGVGKGDPLTGGYSDYGSLGNYSIAISGVTQTLQITTSSLPDATVGTSYSAQLAAIGGVAPYAWTKVSGPAWSNVSSSGSVTGIPTTVATESLTFSVADSNGTSVQQSLNLVVKTSSIAITTTSIPNGSTRKSYMTQLSASGGSGIYSWLKDSGNLPSGLTLNSNGTISGNPSSKGTFTFTARVTDSLSATTTRSFTFKIN